jgi:hypothetical protein
MEIMGRVCGETGVGKQGKLPIVIALTLVTGSA